MTKTKYPDFKVGCYVDGSASSADYLNGRIVDFAESFGFEYEPLPGEDSEDYSQFLSETADDAVNFLNDLEQRPYMGWTVDDNSLFLTANVDDARESVDFVSGVDADYPPDDYRGEWLHVSDHGNATLYVRSDSVTPGKDYEDREIWGIV